jgi:hypothetical protein
MEPVMRSGAAAAKLGVAKIRMETMSVESLDKDSKGDDERRMVTPWRSRIVGDWQTLSMLLFV